MKKFSQIKLKTIQKRRPLARSSFLDLKVGRFPVD